jgi:sec-independent protein translocase protein TatA
MKPPRNFRLSAEGFPYTMTVVTQACFLIPSQTEDFMGKIGLTEILLIAFVFILLFGAKKLPEVGAAIGQAIREFKRTAKDVESGVKDAVDDKKK